MKTMKILFLVLVLAFAAVALVACGHEHEYGEAYSYDGSHHWKEGACEHEDAEDAAPITDFGTHTMSAWSVVETPTCGKAGKQSRHCTVCGFEDVEVLPAEGEHTWEQEGDADKLHREQNTGSKLIYMRKKCSVCGAKSAPIEAYNAAWSYDTVSGTHFHAPSDASKEWGRLDEAAHTITTRYTHSKGSLYFEESCSVCGYTKSTKVEGGVPVTDMKSAQAALDAATEGAIIYFFPANYGTLYLRTVKGNTEYAATEDWAGGSGKIIYREFKNVTLMGAPGATFSGFAVESLEYTPVGPNLHSSNKEDYFYGAIALTNLTFKDIAFRMDRTTAGAAVHIENFCAVDGLTFDGCSLSYTGEGTLSTSARLLYGLVVPYELKDAEGTTVLTAGLKNITIKNCTVDGAYQVVELRGTENVTIENNTFKNIADRMILLAGSDAFTGEIKVKNNTVNGLGQRFLRAASVSATVTVTGNTVTNYTGTDSDIVKVEGTTTLSMTLAELNAPAE